MHAIDGIPQNCQILHVEQEVVGDDTTALQCVLNSDIERTQLLGEEARLLALQDAKSSAAVDKDGIAQRLEEIYKRLEFIDAYSAEARAASILAVSLRRLPLWISIILFSYKAFYTKLHQLLMHNYRSLDRLFSHDPYSVVCHLQKKISSVGPFPHLECIDQLLHLL